MIHEHITDGSVLQVKGKLFIVNDLRETISCYQGDETYYGRKISYTPESHIPVTTVNNLDILIIDAKEYILIIKNIDDTDTIMFLTKKTFDIVKNTILDNTY